MCASQDGSGDGVGRVQSEARVAVQNTTTSVFFLGCVDQRDQRLHRHSQRSARETVDVSCVNPNYFTARVEYRAAASSMGRGGIVDQLIADHVAQVTNRGGRANQR